jgi:hypothetical protein
MSSGESEPQAPQMLYWRVYHDITSDERNSPKSLRYQPTARISVDDLETLEDAQLRTQLEAQLEDLRSGCNVITVPLATIDGVYKPPEASPHRETDEPRVHNMKLDTYRALFKLDRIDEEPMVEPVPEPKLRIASKLARVFGRNRA